MSLSSMSRVGHATRPALRFFSLGRLSGARQPEDAVYVLSAGCTAQAQGQRLGARLYVRDLLRAPIECNSRAQLTQCLDAVAAIDDRGRGLLELGDALQVSRLGRVGALAITGVQVCVQIFDRGDVRLCWLLGHRRLGGIDRVI